MTRFTSFQRLALWTTAATYFLILVGGLVRASGAGLGCPDWPRCFGGWVPPMSAADLPPQFDPSQFNQTLMWTEYLNRLLGVTVGFMVLATAVSAWRHHRRDSRILWTTIGALLLTGFQGWLGGRVVAHELAAWIVTAHLIVALVIVQMLLYVTVAAMAPAAGAEAPALQATSPGVRRATASAVVRGDKPLGLSIALLIVVRGDKPLGLSIALLIVVTLIQVALGTQVRGGVDAAIDAGVARNSALATLGSISVIHRDAAVVVLLGAFLLTFWLVTMRDRHIVLIRWSWVVLVLAAGQVALGVVMAYVSLLPGAQVGHLTLASLLLGAETVMLLVSWSGSAAGAVRHGVGGAAAGV